MKSDRTRWSVFVRTVMLALLLAAQASVLAHDFDHQGTAGDSLCATCSASHTQAGATLDSDATPSVAPLWKEPKAQCPESTLPERPAGVRARAPPTPL